MLDMTVGDRVREARKEAGLTQAALARAAKVTRSAVSQIESGLIKKLSAENLFPYAKALGVSPLWLMTGQQPKRPIDINDAQVTIAPSPNAPDMVIRDGDGNTIIIELKQGTSPTPSIKLVQTILEMSAKGELNNSEIEGMQAMLKARNAYVHQPPAAGTDDDPIHAAAVSYVDAIAMKELGRPYGQDQRLRMIARVEAALEAKAADELLSDDDQAQV